MIGGPTFAIEDARWYARQLLADLTDACGEIMVCGDVRRELLFVGTLHVVCTPRTGRGESTLFDDGRELIGEKLDRLIRSEKVPELRSRSPRRVVFLFRPSADGRPIKAAVEIVRRPASFGLACVRATGPGHFWRLLIKRGVSGGMLQEHKVESGQLFAYGEPIWTPTESDVFEALRLPCISPRSRTVERLQAAIRERGRLL